MLTVRSFFYVTMNHDDSLEGVSALDLQKSPVAEMLDVLQQATYEALRSDDLQTLSCVRSVLKDAVKRLHDATGKLVRSVSGAHERNNFIRPHRKRF